nr:MAG TPA_asm: LH3 HEXON-INTERLACING CAPSID protein, CAPSID PROTEIN, BETA-HELIX [Caudoviricetes sp.]
MKSIKSCTFEDTNVLLDGFSYENCTFTRCKIVYSATDTFALVNNRFNDCKWSFEGPAGNTLQFLKAMYKDMGDFGKQMVEATFENIKK